MLVHVSLVPAAHDALRVGPRVEIVAPKAQRPSMKFSARSHLFLSFFPSFLLPLPFSSCTPNTHTGQPFYAANIPPGQTTAPNGEPDEATGRTAGCTERVVHRALLHLCHDLDRVVHSARQSIEATEVRAAARSPARPPTHPPTGVHVFVRNASICNYS